MPAVGWDAKCQTLAFRTSGMKLGLRTTNMHADDSLKMKKVKKIISIGRRFSLQCTVHPGLRLMEIDPLDQLNLTLQSRSISPCFTNKASFPMYLADATTSLIMNSHRSLSGLGSGFSSVFPRSYQYSHVPISIPTYSSVFPRSHHIKQHLPVYLSPQHTNGTRLDNCRSRGRLRNYLQGYDTISIMTGGM